MYIPGTTFVAVAVSATLVAGGLTAVGWLSREQAIGCWFGAVLAAYFLCGFHGGFSKPQAPESVDSVPQDRLPKGSVQPSKLLIAEFEAAADQVSSGAIDITRATQDRQLEIYALFKQATRGDCNSPKPSALQMAAAAKWEAWNRLKGVPESAAMQTYVAAVTSFQNGPAGSSAQPAGHGLGAVGLKGGLEAAGDWYQDEHISENVAADSGSGDAGRSIRDCAREGQTIELRHALSKVAPGNLASVVDSVDEAGRSALIWAADRGHSSAVACLLEHGASVDLQSVTSIAAFCYTLHALIL